MLKTQHSKTNIMVSCGEWQIDRETMETLKDLIFLGSVMVTAPMKLRHFLLRRKAMTNQDSILRSRNITLPKKVCIVKAMVFPVFMYGCESWTIKKVEHLMIHAFDCDVGEDS